MSWNRWALEPPREQRVVWKRISYTSVEVRQPFLTQGHVIPVKWLGVRCAWVEYNVLSNVLSFIVKNVMMMIGGGRYALP